MRVLLHYTPGPLWRRELSSLSDQGFHIDCCDETDDRRFYSLLPEAEVLWHALRPISAADIAKAANLRLIQKIGVGVNTIDLEAARTRDIQVCNMPNTNTQAVAEMTLLLMLACLRRLPVLDRATREGRGWNLDPSLQDTYGELGEKSVGLVGYGAVGQMLAPILEAMGARVIYTDLTPNAKAARAISGASRAFARSRYRLFACAADRVHRQSDRPAAACDHAPSRHLD